MLQPSASGILNIEEAEVVTEPAPLVPPPRGAQRVSTKQEQAAYPAIPPLQAAPSQKPQWQQQPSNVQQQAGSLPWLQKQPQPGTFQQSGSQRLQSLMSPSTSQPQAGPSQRTQPQSQTSAPQPQTGPSQSAQTQPPPSMWQQRPGSQRFPSQAQPSTAQQPLQRLTPQPSTLQQQRQQQQQQPGGFPESTVVHILPPGPTPDSQQQQQQQQELAQKQHQQQYAVSTSSPPPINFKHWKASMRRLGNVGVTLNDIRLHGAAACILQVIITTILPLLYFFMVYKKDSRLWFFPIVTWAITASTGAVGLLGFILVKSLLLGLHAVLGLCLATAAGVFNTVMWLSLNDKCDRVQSSFRGCQLCVCAASNTCTKDELRSALCSGCKAWGTDVCDDIRTPASAMPYTGLIELLVIGLPCIFSFMCLMRLEAEKGSVGNRLQYARNVVSRERPRLEEGHPLGTDLAVFRELLRTMMAYGNDTDRANARRCCALLQMDLWTLLQVGGLSRSPSDIIRHMPPTPTSPGGPKGFKAVAPAGWTPQQQLQPPQQPQAQQPQQPYSDSAAGAGPTETGGMAFTRTLAAQDSSSMPTGAGVEEASARELPLEVVDVEGVADDVALLPEGKKVKKEKDKEKDSKEGKEKEKKKKKPKKSSVVPTDDGPDDIEAGLAGVVVVDPGPSSKKKKTTKDKDKAKEPKEKGKEKKKDKDKGTS